MFNLVVLTVTTGLQRVNVKLVCLSAHIRNVGGRATGTAMSELVTLYL